MDKNDKGLSFYLEPTGLEDLQKLIEGEDVVNFEFLERLSKYDSQVVVQILEGLWDIMGKYDEGFSISSEEFFRKSSILLGVVCCPLRMFAPFVLNFSALFFIFHSPEYLSDKNFELLCRRSFWIIGSDCLLEGRGFFNLDSFIDPGF